MPVNKAAMRDHLLGWCPVLISRQHHWQVLPPETDAAEGVERLEGTPSKGRGLRFTDKDEHMYFWFPLLAGLSELTFDPRADIRCACPALCESGPRYMMSRRLPAHAASVRRSSKMTSPSAVTSLAQRHLDSQHSDEVPLEQDVQRQRPDIILRQALVSDIRGSWGAQV